MMKEKKRFRRLMYWKLMEGIITNPLFLLAWAAAWFHMYSLCKYGRVYKNLPVLAGCALCFAVFFVLFIFLCTIYKQKNGEGKILRLTEAGQDSLSAEDGVIIRFQEIRRASESRKLLCLFLKERRFAVLRKDGLDRDMRFYVKQKLGQLPFRKRSFLKPAAYVVLSVVMAAGTGGIVSSLMPYNGKLYSFIHTLQTQTKMKYVHNNIYEDGIDGLLEDLETKLELPQTAAEEFSGPAISVFVPDKEKEISPVRYIFCEDVTKEKNVRGRIAVVDLGNAEGYNITGKGLKP